jgi:hypothetical protein
MRDALRSCPRCLEFEEEIRVLRQRLAASGQYVMYSPRPNSNPNVEDELRQWLRTSPNADAAAGFRAGWTRLARFMGPRLCDWESRWLRARRDRDGLKSHIGALAADVERLRDSR